MHPECFWGQALQANAKAKALLKSPTSQRTERNCCKKICQLLKIKTADTQADRKESKMTIIRKLNNDNGLQNWKTEHLALIELLS